MADGMDSDHLALRGDLDRAGHDRHLDELAGPAAADPIAGPSERDRAAAVDAAGDTHAGGGWARPPDTCGALGHGAVGGPVSLGVGGDEDPGVEDLDETGPDHDLDGLTGESRSHPAGAAVQFRMLSTAGIKTDAAAGGLAASSLLSVGGLLALPILTLPAVLGGSGVSHALIAAALVGVAGFAVYVGLGIVLLGTERPLLAVGRAVQWLWNKLRHHRPPLVGLDQWLLVQRNEIRRELGREWKMILLLVAGRLGFDFLCLLAALRATGSQAHPWLVLLAYSSAGIIALLPVTPGGLGIVEASLSGLLVLAGVDASKAVVATLAYRLAQYWLPTIGGAISYGLFRRRYGAEPT